MNYRYGDVARSMEELPELLGRLEQLRFVEWDTHGASLVVFWGVSRAVSTRPILMRLSAMDSETHPAMHARVTFIETTAKSVASLKHADAPFATDAPFLSFAEPALLLTLSPRHTLGAEKRNGDLCNSPASAPPFRWRQRKIRRRRPPRAAPRRGAADAVQSLGPARPSPRAVYHKPRRRR